MSSQARGGHERRCARLFGAASTPSVSDPQFGKVTSSLKDTQCLYCGRLLINSYARAAHERFCRQRHGG